MTTVVDARSTRWVLGALLCAVVTIAQPEARAADSKKVLAETEEAWAAIKDYSADQREEALRKSGKAIEALDQRIAELEAEGQAKWSTMSSSARLKWSEGLTSLRTQRTDLAEWYGAMKHSSANAWEHVKSAFSASFNVLKDSLRTAKDEF